MDSTYLSPYDEVVATNKALQAELKSIRDAVLDETLDDAEKLGTIRQLLCV